MIAINVNSCFEIVKGKAGILSDLYDLHAKTPYLPEKGLLSSDIVSLKISSP